MSHRIKLVRGDTGPQIRLNLTDEVTGQAIDLTSCTVTLHFRAVGDAVALFSLPVFINPEQAAAGVCYIDWEPGNLDLDGGDYEGEIEVVRADGSKETLYDLLKFRLREDFA